MPKPAHLAVTIGTELAVRRAFCSQWDIVSRQDTWWCGFAAILQAVGQPLVDPESYLDGRGNILVGARITAEKAVFQRVRVPSCQLLGSDM